MALNNYLNITAAAAAAGNNNPGNTNPAYKTAAKNAAHAVEMTNLPV